MEANDPRHGTIAGERAHRVAGQAPCRPCAEASNAYLRRTRALRGTRPMNLRDSLGTHRRIQSLMYLGWSGQQIANDAGIDQKGLWALFRRDRITAAVADRIAATYDRMSMSLPPADTKGQRISVVRTRGYAARRGFPPPLAWDDIDNDPHPVGYDRAGQTRSTTVDHALVDRILSGDFTLAADANRLEKLEVVARWTGSDKALEEKTRWNVARLRRDPRMQEAS